MSHNTDPQEIIFQSRFSPHEIPDISVGEYFRQLISRVIAEDRQKIAFIDAETGQTITYVELRQKSLQICSGLAKYLIPLFPPKGDTPKAPLCMFFGDNCLSYIEALVAMAFLGIPVTPNSPANGPYEIAQRLEDSGATMMCVTASRWPVIETLLSDATYRHLITQQLKLLILIENENDKDDENLKQLLCEKKFPSNLILLSQLFSCINDDDDDVDRDQDLKESGSLPLYLINPATDHYLIVYTSGSTGLPKGAIHTHRSFIASILAIQCSMVFVEYSRNATISFLYPFGHISGTIILANCFASGMTAIIYGSKGVPEKSVILRSIERYRISFLIMFLPLAADIVANDYTLKYDLTSLRLMFFAGSKISEVVSRTLRERYHVAVHELYGATEMMGSVSPMRKSDADSHMPGDVGEPLPGVEMKIVDVRSGESLGHDRDGELWLRGPNRFAGYLNNIAATQSTIDPDGWYRTGDVARFTADRRLFIVDRIKELLKYKHWSISPAEIEAFLLTHPAISASCVVGVPHRTEGAHLRAYVQLNDSNVDEAKTETEIVDYVKANMGYQKRLNAGVHLIASIPRTIIGKIDRKYFKNLVANEIITQEAEK